MLQSIRFKNLQFDIEDDQHIANYRLTGDVDEYFQYIRVPLIIKPLVQFDVSGITNFNSVGIREWTRLMTGFPKSSKIEFVKASVAMVDQINMVPECLGHGKIVSFFAPYYCACGVEATRLLDVEACKEDIAHLRAPPLACVACGQKLQFDALEESYFSAIANSLQTVA